MDAFKGFCERYRVDPATGERNFAVIQAEDELAAIGNGGGASWNGARAFTPTSGPGVSLMNEFVGPSVFTRGTLRDFRTCSGRPSTGMPTRTQQSDINAVRLCIARRHAPRALVPGEPGGVLLHGRAGIRFGGAPANAGIRAVRLGYRHERLDVPRFEMGRRISSRPRQGTVGRELAGLDKFYRYVDRDDDAISYRTLPGVSPKGAYFTRGSGHNQYGTYTEDSAEYQVVLDRLRRKFTDRRKVRSKPELLGKSAMRLPSSASAAAMGPSVRRSMCFARRKIHVDYLRIKAFPFGLEVEGFLSAHARIFIVEQNRDAQTCDRC